MPSIPDLKSHINQIQRRLNGTDLTDYTRGQLQREMELKEQQLALEERKEELRKLKEFNKCIADANDKLDRWKKKKH